MPDFAAEKTFAVFDNPANRKLIAELESAGAKVFNFPAIQAEAISEREILKRIEMELMNFDWVIFPDVLAVDYALRILETIGADLFELDALRFCAFGEATADQLRFVQLHTDVIPNRCDSETVWSALKDYIGAENFPQLKFLILKEISHKIELAEKLTAEKSEVLELPVYQIKPFDGKEIARLKTLLAGGAIDEFVFTAPTDIIALRLIFGGESLSEIFSEVKVSAVDGNIYQSLKEHGLERAGLFRADKIVKVVE